MPFKLSIGFILLVAVSQGVYGLVDVTTALYGRTIYAKYIYPGFTNTWMGPFGEADVYFAEYDGYLRGATETNIFDPDKKVRLFVKDCGNGFACLMTRWREEQGYTYYLQADWLDVDFEPSISPSSAIEFHWQILCDSTDYQVCYFGNRYYPDSSGYARIYGTNTYTLKTDWVTDNPVSWYQFKLVVPPARSEGLVMGDRTVCNTGSMPVATKMTLRQGTELGVNAPYPWTLTASLLQEVKAAFQAGLTDSTLDDAISWSFEMAGGVAFQRIQETTMNVTVQPSTRAYLVQLTGAYGPYVVRGTNVILREEACT